ncbi:MAG TPA: DUF559 domain-containing protein [Fimbriimonadaceae bacterium]|nr:DUF559 domain-containing protein [Fimbriimonadaceae bacterium]
MSQLLPNNTRNRSAKNSVRKLRKAMSVSEKVVWDLIRKGRLGFDFRRQYAVGPYFLDFYCPEAKVCVEVDGEQHEARKDRDRVRDEFLANKGILTLRVPSLAFFDYDTPEASKFLDLVRRTCEERAGRKDWDR